MTATPNTPPSSADPTATGRVISATALTLTVPGARIQDYPQFGQTGVLIDLDGVVGSLFVLDEGTVNVSLSGVPAYAVDALLQALTAGQGGLPR